MKTIHKAFLLLNYIAIASASAAIITPALPQMEQYYQLNSGLLEWVVTIFLLGYTLGQFIYAPLANRFGRLTALRIGLVINLVGIIICLLVVQTHYFSLLLFGRFITALGASSGLVCTFILISESFKESVTKQVLAYAIVAFTVSIAITVFLGGVITQYWGWQYCFSLLLIHGIILLLFTTKITETLEKKAQQAINLRLILTSYLHAFSHKRFVAFSIIYALNAVFAYTFSAAGPMITHHYFKLDAISYGTWNIENMLGMLAGGIIASLLLKRFTTTVTLNLGLGVLSLSYLSLLSILLLNSQSVLWFFSTSMMMYLATGIILPSASLCAMAILQDKAHASATMNFINMGSALVCVAIMGYLPFDSFVAFLSVLAIFLLLAIVLQYLLQRNQKDTALSDI